ncbi:RIP metalloprotease RseP [Bordetella pertussis]|uniref:RIP metalloprotease RseP n=1 Tax=Bordetella pertussis TaxID=520 RepID=UPI0005E9B5DE|nr:RIP metalloprotease RseP [Bordetella pertussis]CFW85015.1 inner membrane protease [Bordetella pertussis]
MLFTLLAFVVALGTLITFHELGHYWIARLCGVRVLRFSVGFGRVLARRTDRHGTEWAISAIPLGGYVKMQDDPPAGASAAEAARSFNAQPVGRRIAIVAAGPLFNLFLAVVLYAGLNLAGTEVPAPVVGQPAAGTPAAQAGLMAGDLDAGALVALIQRHAGQPLALTVQRGADRLTLTVVPRAESVQGQEVGRIGVQLGGDIPMVTVRYGVIDSVWRGVQRTWDTAWLSLRMMGRMVLGEVSWRNISGPVTIADYAGQTARIGLKAYIAYLALISISLGVLNLLPIPMLDGGHLLYYLVEIVKGSPVSDRWIDIGQRAGIGLLAGLMGLALFNDFARLFT